MQQNVSPEHPNQTLFYMWSSGECFMFTFRNAEPRRQVNLLGVAQVLTPLAGGAAIEGVEDPKSLTLFAKVLGWTRVVEVQRTSLTTAGVVILIDVDR